jgi:hypothetical protein
MSLIASGTPVLGYVSLTNAAPGPVAFALTLNGAPHVLTPQERLYITNIAASNDGTAALVTVDDGPLNACKLMSVYLGTLLPPAAITIEPGVGRLQFGQIPRATASAVTGGTVECILYGYLART